MRSEKPRIKIKIINPTDAMRFRSGSRLSRRNVKIRATADARRKLV